MPFSASATLGLDGMARHGLDDGRVLMDDRGMVALSRVMMVSMAVRLGKVNAMTFSEVGTAKVGGRGF